MNYSYCTGRKFPKSKQFKIQLKFSYNYFHRIKCMEKKQISVINILLKLAVFDAMVKTRLA